MATERMIPLFKSHYSLYGRSILTYGPKGKAKSDEPDSIVDIACDNDMKQVVLVEDFMSGLLEAYTNLKEHKIQMIFGLRLNIANVMSIEKNPDAHKTEAKYIVFANNKEGYNTLIEISTKANTEGIRKLPRKGHNIPRITFEYLKSKWSKNLTLAIPFYDGFIFNNLLMGYQHVPNEEFLKKATFFMEDNEHPFDQLILEATNDLTKNTESCKSIYYKNRKDFKAWMTAKCIAYRSSLEKPELNHCTSNEFCWEALSRREGSDGV